jgi:hypothetical protein
MKRYKTIEAAIGNNQHSAVAAGNLRRVGGVSGTTSDVNYFTFGLLEEPETSWGRPSMRQGGHAEAVAVFVHIAALRLRCRTQTITPNSSDEAPLMH